MEPIIRKNQIKSNETYEFRLTMVTFLQTCCKNDYWSAVQKEVTVSNETVVKSRQQVT